MRSLKNTSEFSTLINRVKETTIGFQEAPRLHLTLLGLFDQERRTNRLYNEKSIEAIKEFFKSKNTRPFEVKFNLVRLGAWYVNRKQRYLLGDGTVVAMGGLDNQPAKRFSQLGKDLVVCLRYKCQIFSAVIFNRKFETVWCTLGYFDTGDFVINKSLLHAFGERA